MAGRRRLGRIVGVGSAEGYLAVACAGGLFSRGPVWRRIVKGQFAPPILEGTVSEAEEVRDVMGSHLHRTQAMADAHIVDLVVNLESGEIDWAVLSEGLWRDFVRGRHVVPFADVMAQEDEVTASEVSQLRLAQHRTRGN